jgi:hypothetical protein
MQSHAPSTIARPTLSKESMAGMEGTGFSLTAYTAPVLCLLRFAKISVPMTQRRRNCFGRSSNSTLVSQYLARYFATSLRRLAFF